MNCKECGSEMEIDNVGVCTHVIEGGGIDFEANADHVACYDVTPFEIFQGKGSIDVITHFGGFHADEVTAIALFKVFAPDTVLNVQRVPHQTTAFPADAIVVDIGREFNGTTRFDHHQHKGGKSSAGLIWDFIGLNDQYPIISELVNMVDENDVGIKKAGPFDYSTFISAYNVASDDSEEQKAAFYAALAHAVVVLSSMKREQDAISNALEVVTAASTVEGLDDVLEFAEYLPGWNTAVNGISRPEIGAVIWKKEEDGTWMAQVTPKDASSFEFHGPAFKLDDSMNFVHAAGFFAVAKDKETLVTFLLNSREV